MQNEVRLQITAEDRVSAKIDILRDKLSKLSMVKPIDAAKATLIQGQIQKLEEGIEKPKGGMGITGAVMFGQLGVAAVLNGIQTIGNQARKTVGAVMEAASLQTGGLATAGDLANQLGVSFAKAKDLVADTRAEISKMSAALPGENKDYNAIFQNISATIAGTTRGNMGLFKKEAMELTQTFGVLAAIRPNVDANTGGSAVNRLMSGTMAIKEAFGTNDIFSKNPLLQKYISEQLKIIGKSEQDWKQLTTETRKRILMSAGKQAVSQETLASFDGTVDSMVATAKATLFDPDIGVFGFLKKIKAAGGRSGLDAVQTGLQALDNLFRAVGRIGAGLGFDSDTVMLTFVRLADFFTDMVNTVTGAINGNNPIEAISGIFGKVFSWLSTALSQVGQFVNNIPWGKLGYAFGAVVGKVMTMLFTRVDWAEVNKTVAKAALGIIVLIGAAIVGAIKGAMDELGNYIKSKIASIGQGVSNFVSAPVAGVGNFISGAIDNVKSVGRVITGQSGAAPVQPNKPGEPMTKVPLSTAKPLPVPAVPMVNDTEKKTAFAPQLIFQGVSGDPNQIAQAVMDRLNASFKDYQANSLA